MLTKNQSSTASTRDGGARRRHCSERTMGSPGLCRRQRSRSGWRPARPTRHSTRSTPRSSPRPPASRSSSISIPHDNHPPAIRAQDALSGAGGFDVYIADQVWLPEFYREGLHQGPLRTSSTPTDKADFAKTAIETVTYQGALVALPIMVHNCAMYYRTDLFEEAGLYGAAGKLGRISRLRQEAHRQGHRRLGHADRQQAGHRGLDPAALASTSRPAATSSTPTASRPSTPMPGTRRWSS